MAALIAVAVLSLASAAATRWRTPYLVLDAAALVLLLALAIDGHSLNHYVGLAALFLLLPSAAVTWVLAMFWLAPRAARAT